ncbi:TPA: phage BR0599 family protein [Vibrio parahaemolyticus]|nr:phage BR0599 family protein [Vibrio parahaemolyticus]
MSFKIELFSFKTKSGNKVWNLTSADSEYLASDGVIYTPAVIGCPAFKTMTSEVESFDLEVSLSFPILKEFRNGVPAEPILITIMREDRITKNRKIYYKGEVLCNDLAAMKSSMSNIMQRLSTNCMRMTYRGMCNHVLYTRHCGLAKADWQDIVVVNEIKNSGTTLVCNLLDKEDNYYANGIISFGMHQVMVTASNQQNSELTLLTPIDGLSVGDEVFVAKGCNKSYESCKSFNNVENFFGCPHVEFVNLFINGFKPEKI